MSTGKHARIVEVEREINYFRQTLDFLHHACEALYEQSERGGVSRVGDVFVGIGAITEDLSERMDWLEEATKQKDGAR